MLWIWLSVLSAGLVAMVLAGRAHSRSLDRAEARAQLLVMPLSTAEFSESTPAAVVPIAVLMGNQILICDAPVDKASEIFKRSGRVDCDSKAAEAPGLQSGSNTIRKPKGHDGFRLKASLKTS